MPSDDRTESLTSAGLAQWRSVLRSEVEVGGVHEVVAFTSGVVTLWKMHIQLVSVEIGIVGLACRIVKSE